MLRLPTALLAAALAALLALPAAAGAWPPCVPSTEPTRIGLREIDRRTDGRVTTLTLRSKAMRGEQRVTVLLPKGYDTEAARRYPVLYLLHGAFGSDRAWLDQGDAERIVGDVPLIVVMPQGGSDGGYSDWVATGPDHRGPVPKWESYHLRELLPFVDTHFRTRPNAAGRAVAGLSMGGHGAMKYAAEHPGTFGYAGSFSGAVHPGLPLYLQLIQECKYGDPNVDRLALDENDPTVLAGNLRGVRLFVRSGDGTGGPLPLDPVEAVVKQMADAFIAALGRAGVRDVDARIGPGTHSWPFWQQDLREFLAWLEPQLGRPVPPPRRIAIRSAKPAFTAWGWRFAARRVAPEPLQLRDVTRRGLTATGRGRLRVTTPPRTYRPGSVHRVAGRRVTATRAGRLSFSVALGPKRRTVRIRIG